MASRRAITIASLALASTASAAVSRTCPLSSSGPCYSINIPDSTASSGNGDIFVQISAPTTYSWIGLGQGTQMAGANIFIMYTSGNGQNVTVSPRLGVGHVEPEHDSGDTAQITMLEGSGVSDGVMTANFRCSNCNSWNGGTMNFQGSSGSWIAAAKSGSALNSDDLGEELNMHDAETTFTLDFTNAKGGSDANPFLAAAQSGNTTTTAAQTSGSVGNVSSSIMIAHGVLASLACVILFPVGGALIRLCSFKHLIALHAGMQLTAYSIFIAAFGMGVYMAHEFHLFSNRHAIIGLIVFAIIVFQPLFGLLHHLQFKKTMQRNLYSFVHLTIGRVAIILGIINGGLGLALAGNATKGDLAAYGVVGGLFGVTYLGVVVYGEVTRYRRLNKETRTHAMGQKEAA